MALPTKTDGSLGREKTTLPGSDPSPDLDYYETVEEHERQKDAIIANANSIGETDGSTPGSLWEAIASIGGSLPVVLVTGPDTEALPSTDALVVLTTAGGAVTLSLPAPASNTGRRYNVIRVNASGSNTVTLARNASEQINGTSGNLVLPGSGTGDRGEWVVWCDGTNWWATGGAGLDRSLELRETSGPTALTLGSIADGKGVARSGTALVGVDLLALTSSAAANLGRTASAGATTTAARADHVHDRGAISYASTVTSSVDLPDSDVIPVDTTSGDVTLSPPEASPVTGAPRKWEILKINAGAFKISVDPKSTQTVQGGSSGAAYDLPDSTATTYPSWTLIRDASGNYRVL